MSSTITYTNASFNFGAQGDSPTDVTFNSDGTKFFLTSTANDSIHEYTLSVGFDLSSTVAYSGESLNITAQSPSPSGIVSNNDDSKFFVIEFTGSTIYEYAVV